MLAKKLAVAAALILGATSLASAQAGRPGAMSYGPGCYGCTFREKALSPGALAHSTFTANLFSPRSLRELGQTAEFSTTATA